MGMAAQCAGARLVAMAPADGRTHQGVRRDCDASVPRNNQAKAPVTVRAGMLVRWATKRQPQQRRSGGRPSPTNTGSARLRARLRQTPPQSQRSRSSSKAWRANGTRSLGNETCLTACPLVARRSTTRRLDWGVPARSLARAGPPLDRAMPLWARDPLARRSTLLRQRYT